MTFMKKTMTVLAIAAAMTFGSIVSSDAAPGNGCPAFGTPAYNAAKGGCPAFGGPGQPVGPNGCPAFGSPAYNAAKGGCPAFGAPGMNPAQAPNLTPDQKQALQQILSQNFTETQSIRQQLAQKGTEISQQLSSGNPDPNRVNQLAREIGQLQDQLNASRANVRAQLKEKGISANCLRPGAQAGQATGPNGCPAFGTPAYDAAMGGCPAFGGAPRGQMPNDFHHRGFHRGGGFHGMGMGMMGGGF